MRFQKGQSGNPGGRRKEQKFRAALAMALSETDKDSGQPKLRRIADNLVNAAIKGESWAIREVADRVDGKAVQAVDLETDRKQSIHDYSDEELLAFIIEAKENGGSLLRAGEEKPSDFNDMPTENRTVKERLLSARSSQDKSAQ